MKQLFLSILVVVACFTTKAQNSKNLVYDANAEVRTVSSFSAVEVSGAIDLYLSQGTEEGVAISAANDEAKSKIKAEVNNGVLHIFFESKGWNWKSWGNTKSKAYVTFKTLKRIEANGACNVIVTEPITLNDLKINCSGASDFKGQVTIVNLILAASGASNISISGNAENANIEASGASNIKAYELQTAICKAEASGAANIRITVNKELKAEASGGATLYYKG
ncbi:MAG: DUF2807 domain-containing protein, partial [Deinococcales bacterium]|nr:DUF2807 domain-containing protein [Chitinophagaceae bacterium]